MARVKSPDSFRMKDKCCYTWTKLFLSASVPVILGIFSVVYTIQQDKLARINREQDLDIARANREQDLSIARENAARDVSEREKIRKQAVYDSYIAEISKTIRNPDFNITDINQLTHIRIQTLNALHQLDHDRKREVILFLYENGLIRTNSPKPVNLRGADLVGVKFVRSATFLCDLKNLYLAEVLADNIAFDGCALKGSVFNRASLNGAKFLNSHAHSSNYEEAYMVGFDFNGTNTRSSNFASADLRNASLASVALMEVNFTNTDLLGSDLTADTLKLDQNTYLNTRFPNGSFSTINTKQLVVDVGAEINCHNGSSNHWLRTSSSPKIHVVNKSYYNGSIINAAEGSCFFKFNKTSDAYQNVNLEQYSVFIDSGQAWYRLSAYLMCRSAKPDDEAYVTVNFVKQDNLFIVKLSARIESTKGTTVFSYVTKQGKIPAKTDHIQMLIGANMTPSTPIGNQTNECYIDRVHFYIFKQLNVSSTPSIVTTENPRP